MLPLHTVISEGCEAITGAVPAVMVKVRIRDCATAPVAVPLTVTLYVPGNKVLVPFKITMVLLPGVTGLVVNETVVPTGFPVAAKLTAPVNPPLDIVFNVILIFCGAGQAAVAPAGVLKLNPDGAGMLADQTPRPYVAATSVRSDARYLSMLTRTLGKLGFASHTVLVPLSKSVSHTPVSVAIIAFVSVSGWKMAQRTGMLGKLPSHCVHVAPPS